MAIITPCGSYRVASTSLVSVGAIRGSHLAQEAGWVYFAEYDPNKIPAHNTA
jgi:hypothetical protein